jgi:nucleoside-diphosphate-sugar epimerase
MIISLTGSTGFLGKYIHTRLVKKGHDIIAFVRDPSKSTLSTNTRKFELDNVDKIDLNTTDVLIHNAAYLPKSFEDPNEAVKCLMNNGIATLKLLQVAEKANVKKFIYISSGTIYDPYNYSANENSPTYPSMRATYYLTSKLVGDIFTDHYKSKMDIVIIRPSSIYGFGMKQSGFLSRVIQNIKNDIIQDNDTGNYNIDLVNVNNVAWMVSEAATNKSIIGIINVGGGLETTTSEVANIIAKILNKKIPINKLPLTNGHAILDITRAKNFGYNPTNLTDGLKSYIESL